MEYSGGVGVVSPLRGGAGSYFLGDLVFYLSGENTDLGLNENPDKVEDELRSPAIKNPVTVKLGYDPDGEELHEDHEESMMYIPTMKYVEPAAMIISINSKKILYLSPELKKLRDAAEQEGLEFAEAA
jgi:hypothetical protein